MKKHLYGGYLDLFYGFFQFSLKKAFLSMMDFKKAG